MKEFYVYEHCCSCTGSFRIEDADQVPILDAEGECCLFIDDFAILDSRGYEIARVQQDSCCSSYNYSIYREDTRIGTIHRSYTLCCETFHLYSGRGHYVVNGTWCDNRYMIERDGGSLVAIITRPFFCALTCNRRVLLQMRDDEDEILLLGATIAICRILRRQSTAD